MYYIIKIPADLTKPVSIITLKERNLSRCLNRNTDGTPTPCPVSSEKSGMDDMWLIYGEEAGLSGRPINARATYLTDLDRGYISGDALLMSTGEYGTSHIIKPLEDAAYARKIIKWLGKVWQPHGLTEENCYENAREPN